MVNNASTILKNNPQGLLKCKGLFVLTSVVSFVPYP